MSGQGNLTHLIYRVSGRRVMLSVDLASIYDVAPKALNQAVKRNRDRFPGDFLFRLTLSEARRLKPEGDKLGWGKYTKYPPYAFTEQGVAT